MFVCVRAEELVHGVNPRWLVVDRVLAERPAPRDGTFFTFLSFIRNVQGLV